MIKEGKVVLPGDKIATTEELIAGDGTYEENGNIYAMVVGIFHVDRKNMIATIEPLASKPLVLKEGETAIGEVKQVGQNMVIVKIIRIAGENRQIAGEKDAAIHISNVSEEYITNLGRKFRIGDIVRAKIIKVEPAIQLSTKGRGCGVIKAFCMNCRNPLIRKNNFLECPVCGRIEERKIADDYGMGELDRVM